MVLLARRPVADRHVQGVAQSLTTTGLAFTAGAGIKPLPVAVNAEEHHLWIFVEDVLCTVAVMHVPIDDEEASQAMGGFGMVCGQRDVIEETEAHAYDTRGMMARRPDQAKSRSI